MQEIQEMWVRSLSWEDPWRMAWQLLAWSIPWAEGSGGLQFTGLQRVGHYWSDGAHMLVGHRLVWPERIVLWSSWFKNADGSLSWTLALEFGSVDLQEDGHVLGRETCALEKCCTKSHMGLDWKRKPHGPSWTTRSCLALSQGRLRTTWSATGTNNPATSNYKGAYSPLAFFFFLHSQKRKHREGEERERRPSLPSPPAPPDRLKLRALFALEAMRKASDQI